MKTIKKEKFNMNEFGDYEVFRSGACEKNDYNNIAGSVEFHTSFEDAKKSVKQLNLQPGTYPRVDVLYFSEHEMPAEITNSETYEWIRDAHLWIGDVYPGEYIKGSVIVTWTKDVPQDAKNIFGICIAGQTPCYAIRTEKHLNSDKFNRRVLMSKQELQGSINVEDAIYEKLKDIGGSLYANVNHLKIRRDIAIIANQESR